MSVSKGVWTVRSKGEEVSAVYGVKLRAVTLKSQIVLGLHVLSLTLSVQKRHITNSKCRSSGVLTVSVRNLFESKSEIGCLLEPRNQQVSKITLSASSSLSESMSKNMFARAEEQGGYQKDRKLSMSEAVASMLIITGRENWFRGTRGRRRARL
ncbi:hypothetical protein J6590_090055 [Homalodisca vitripennis]|nr:hypothetical protein J6590_090055 [Homalodisca vitripennis]